MLSVKPVMATRPAPLCQPPPGQKTITATVAAKSSVVEMVLKGSPFTYKKGAVLLSSFKWNHRASFGLEVTNVSQPPIATPSPSAMASTRNTSPRTLGVSDSGFMGASTMASSKN